MTVTEERRARLPGYREEAVVRHFDAPEAIETRFYEVRAKSILNRVPEASQVPFRWTVNPYRGCTHACTYCLAGDTPILLADGRHAPISDVEVGAAIYGTVREDRRRRYALTRVLDKWITVKPAFRVTLHDGTELIASADHRFLTERGWRHVANAPPGGAEPAQLAATDSLVGTGRFAEQPVGSRDYRRGYLCGIVRRTGHIVGPRDSRRVRRGDEAPCLGLDTNDLETLRRTRAYVEHEESPLSERQFAQASGARREALVIATRSGSLVNRAADLIEWPALPSVEWCRGFLAGSFDADGSRGSSSLRIASYDATRLRYLESCARRLGFDPALERSAGEGAGGAIRVRGGLADQLRFLHLTDPAGTRNRSIDGEALEAASNLQIASVEPLGVSLPLYDITTGTGDFIANGIVSHNCFARPTHTYLDFDARRDFEREIVVKINAPERLRAELARPSWQHEHVALGTNTDPYQWVEGRYKLMRGIWEAMRDAANPCSVLTKSPLLLRDLDLMRELNQRTEFSAALSVPTVDERAWRATEPRTPHPRARLEAVAELARAGIRTGILVAPLMPGINDRTDQVAPILDAAEAAGAAYVTGIGLHLRTGVRDVFFEWLADHRPDLVERYEQLYRRGAYLPLDERRRLASLVKGPDLPVGTRMRGADPASPRRPRQSARRGSNAPPAQQPGQPSGLTSDFTQTRQPPQTTGPGEVQIPLF